MDCRVTPLRGGPAMTAVGGGAMTAVQKNHAARSVSRRRPRWFCLTCVARAALRD